MALHIKNPCARELAKRLADRRKISMTKAVIEALNPNCNVRSAAGHSPSGSLISPTI
ncbi:type II toxin-antitoxin system VapB family antitoxin [Mesorhizobium sp. WSM4906]|uniref:type II toxin-antitoxin system VapB family antitoxin n=1 Tax=Mesorhizobium sp. WSM4906 TaxID=3038546 RepID=UPI0024174D53|nr:type II toxin-antitoxin system VapB family antitoxin [Mesorhizobium sp. WSM4906]WFP76039.1 type II toxin-antitoxin system VapB family antitoxin [Mesorhizobium sp. WSM4906]